MRTSKNTATGALLGIWAILLVSFVIAVLSVGKDILIPIALAALITFLLAPLVSRLEDWIGRIAAVVPEKESAPGVSATPELESTTAAG